MKKHYNPVSTYRIQFSGEYPFSRFNEISDYLEKLGIGTVYASPVFSALKGSTHGYDVIRHDNINPEIGNASELEIIRSGLKERQIGWIQDIVPNHMAFDPSNPYIFDLLENGIHSAFHDFFDVDWTHPDKEMNGRIILPFFGQSVDQLINNEKLKLVYREEGYLCFLYYEKCFPANAAVYPGIFRKIHNLPSSLHHALNEFTQGNDKGINIKLQILKHHFQTEMTSDNKFRRSLISVLDDVNANRSLLKNYLSIQHYLPVHWQTTSRKINYRRFFTINGMICLNMHLDKVRELYHRYCLKLTKKGIFSGLRIDHIDGIYQPGNYLEWLRKQVGKDTFIIVEKILEKDEKLPDYWPVQGTTGYEFLAAVNNLFTCNQAEGDFQKIRESIIKKKLTDYNDLIYNKKKYILYERMNGELENLTRLFIDLKISNEYQSFEALQKAIGEFLLQCPVYRLYLEKDIISARDEKMLIDIFNRAISNISELQPVLEMLKNELSKVNTLTGKEKQNRLHFLRRSMQFTGPLTAKGVEDTSFYTYNLFIAHNEVGDSPGYYGITVPEFHRLMADRKKYYPLALNTTSTHDTKRGEDFRARLNVLSDIPALWGEKAVQWKKMTVAHKTTIDNKPCPSEKNEYFIYQSLAGGLPFFEHDREDFTERFISYIIKAIREGKEESSWTSPNEQYEKHVKKFILNILSPGSDFYNDLYTFARKICDYGYLNSLSQTVLKITCPGVPDIYQGSELWNFSMVDPDNRRPVNYDIRKKYINEFYAIKQKDTINYLNYLWKKRDNGKIKHWITMKLLLYRKQHPGLFEYGEYRPLYFKGERSSRVMGYIRQHHNEIIITVIPLHLAMDGISNIIHYNWKNTRCDLPFDKKSIWHDLIRDQYIEGGESLWLSGLFKSIPISVLTRVQDHG